MLFRVKKMKAVITDLCPFDCRLPVNLPNEFAGKNVQITIEIVEPPAQPVQAVEEPVVSGTVAMEETADAGEKKMGKEKVR